MPTWDERFRGGSYPTDPEPSPILRDYLGEIPDGRALDVATGTGRNAVYLAERGYAVEAIDQSRAGLEITRERAAERDAADRLDALQVDVEEFRFPTARYDLLTVSFYRAVDRFPDLVEALAPGGYLFVEHHLRSTEETPSGPSGDRYRFGANELLRAGLGLTVVHYDEGTEERDGGRRATAQLLARNSSGIRQAYPQRPRSRD
jgi:SAM-dependent methyltransferase